MIRCPFSLEKMRYAPDSGMVVYRSKPHATLKRNYQLMPAIKWLRLLMNHIPDKYEHLVRYYGDYSNRSRGARRLIENGDDTAGSIRIDDTPANTRCKASWARLMQGLRGRSAVATRRDPAPVVSPRTGYRLT